MPPLADPVAPIKRTMDLNRQLPTSTAMMWLKAGWSDFKDHNMEASLIYGIVVTVLSMLIVAGLFVLKIDYILFPVLAAFMVVGPALAIGLYEKSRRIETNERVSIGSMLSVKAKSKGQILFVGLILMLWTLLWLRAGVLLYALFFGMHEFPGIGGIVDLILTTPSGWGLLITGTLFGGLFAGFAFAIGVIAVPMLLNEKTDAFTAMGSSIALTWHNLPVMMAWGSIVLGLFVLCLLTGLLGMIVFFPVVGHATWHVYKAIRIDPGAPIFVPAMASDTQSL